MAAVHKINGVDVTAQTDFASISYEENAGVLNAILRFDCFQNPGDPALDILERYEVTHFDGSNHWFGGIITSIQPTQLGQSLVYSVECADFSALSDTRTVLVGLTTAGWSDVQIIQMAWAYRNDVDSSTFVSTLSSYAFPQIDLTGWSIRRVMDWVCKFTGGVWWVDADKKLHYTKAQPGERVNDGAVEKGGAAWTLAATIGSVAAEGNFAGSTIKHIGNGTVGANATTQVISAAAGQTFFLSIDGKCSVANNWQAFISWRNGSNAEISQSSFGSLTAASTWTHLTALAVAPANTASAVVTLKLNSNASTATGWWDNMSVQQLTSPVGFSDTPTESGVIPLRAYESPQGPRRATDIANRLRVYGTGYSTTIDYAPGIAYLKGNIVEAQLYDELVTDASSAQFRADAFFAKYGLPDWQLTIEHQETQVRAGLVVPFFWSLGGVAAPITITKQTGQYVGGAFVLTATLGGNPATGGGISQVVASQGTLLGTTAATVFDTIAPAVPAGLAVSSSVGQNADGSTFPIITATWTQASDIDFDHYEVQLADDSGFTTNVRKATTALSGISFSPVLGNRTYWVRVRAFDWSNNASAFCTPVSGTTAKDSTAPAVPNGLTAFGGFRLISAAWARNSEPDLAKYQVRWSPQLSGAPDPDSWQRADVYANVAVLSGLEPGTVYYIQVRAIDSSNNVATSETVATAVDADLNPDAGWSNTNSPGAYVTATPTAIGTADIAANSITANLISTDGLDASVIKTGTLSVGGSGITPPLIQVFSTAGVLIGQWDANGLILKDPTNTLRQIRLLNGVIAFSLDGGATFTTAISADGIQADAIKLGIAPGGHNAVPNSSFELAPFVAASTILTKTWTISTDWAATIGTNQNLGTGGNDLTMTSAT